MSPDKQVSNPSAYQPQPAYEDEISLVDIVNLLLRRKKIILGVTVITLCIGLLYAFTANRVYQVETILSPPSNKIIQSFNLKNLQSVKKEDIYSSFTQIIETRRLRQDFFNKFNIIETLSDIPESKMTTSEINKIFENFSDSLKVAKKTKNDKNDKIKITLEGADKGKIGPWLDSFVAFADSTIVNRTVNDIREGINYKIKNLKLQIKNKRIFYNQRRDDELERLHENYRIAQKLGIIERNDSKNMVSSKNNLSIYMSDTKRYMEGTKVLQAEINAIKNRKSDDIHIVGLRALQEELTTLEAIKVENDKLQTFSVDKKAIVNIEPIRPKTKLIVMLSLILGGLLGILGVFILEFINKLKKQVNNDSDFDNA